ncbi:MAG: LysR family transcriptional regulator [Eubacteriales bacterium]|nr:LysR family transcriptional regulator [Eubacteriales bacterium]
MNLMYMKYAVEIAACGSLNQAAKKLYIGQPNLSRAIRELEASLGVTIFERSAKGMEITPDGEVFLKYARSILSQVDTVENIFKKGMVNKKRFSISVPRASYISEAFSEFSKCTKKGDEVEMFYKETNSMRAIKNILQEDYKLGIIRYAKNYDRYYKEMLEQKGLTYEIITEFHYVLIMSEKSPLAKKEHIAMSDLAEYTEIAHADPYVPSLPVSAVKKEELPESERCIFVFERASQFELLSSNTDTFMWVSPVPPKVLERYGLVMRVCDDNKKVYRDVMIKRSDYKLSELDNKFIYELCRVKREIFK